MPGPVRRFAVTRRRRLVGIVVVLGLVLAGLPAAYWWDQRGAADPPIRLAAAWDTYLLDGDPGADHDTAPYLAIGAVEGREATGFLAFEVPRPLAGQPLGSVTLAVRLARPVPSTVMLFWVPEAAAVAGTDWRAGAAERLRPGPLLSITAPAGGISSAVAAFDLTGVVERPGRYVFALRSPPMDGPGRVVSGNGGRDGPQLLFDAQAAGAEPVPAGQQRALQAAPPLPGVLGAAPSERESPSAAATEPGPAPGTPPGPATTGRIEVGATVQLDGAAQWAQAYARADTDYGRMRMFRVFYPGLPPEWPGGSADAAARTVNVSFKAEPAEVLAGAHDSVLARWFAGMPADRDIYWTYYHEPEDNVEAGEFTAAQYRDAWSRVAWLASQVDNVRLYPTLVLMGWTLEPGAGRNWRDFYPGPEVIAVLGWDVYNFDHRVDQYSEPAVLFDRVIEVSRAEGKPWGLAEFGARRVAGDESGQRRAEWIRATTGYLSAHSYPPQWVAWYDALIGDGEDYRLLDEPSRAAWREFVDEQR